MKIKTQKISSYFHLVTADGIEIGFLRKAPGSSRTRTPYQPMTMDNEMLVDSSSPSGFMACYGKDGKGGADAKRDAINALVKALPTEA